MEFVEVMMVTIGVVELETVMLAMVVFGNQYLLGSSSHTIKETEYA